MLQLDDPATIRALLETDRVWSVYALGDLAPGFAEHAEWRATADGSALILLYRLFEIPVLFTLGAPENLAPLLSEITDPELYLSIRPEILPLVQARYTVHPTDAMWRMALNPARFVPVPTAGLARLTLDHLPDLLALYADGHATGETPDFFDTTMLANGIFFGAFEKGRLIASAGTHLVSAELGVAAIGNVYTRRDRRGLGWAAKVTSAVLTALHQLSPPPRTIALNVKQANLPAQKVYQKLGFDIYCPFYEGRARCL